MATYSGQPQPLALMMQATALADTHRAEAVAAGVPLLFEAFADRCYADDGSLLPRNQPDALHDRTRMLAQVAQLKSDSTITTRNGHVLRLQVDTLCVHGDNPEGVAAIEAIRSLLCGN